MAVPQPVKLTKRAVDALCVSSGETVVWDRDLPGFGVRIYATGSKVWCVQAWGQSGKPKRKALGRYREVTPEKARQEAVIAIDRIKRGWTLSHSRRRRSLRWPISPNVTWSFTSGSTASPKPSCPSGPHRARTRPL